MKSKVSTASFSMAAFWLAVRIEDFCLGGVAGDLSRLEMGLSSLGLLAVKKCDVSGVPVSARVRGKISAGGAKEGPGDDFIGACRGLEGAFIECSRQNDSYVRPPNMDRGE